MCEILDLINEIIVIPGKRGENSRNLAIGWCRTFLKDHEKGIIKFIILGNESMQIHGKFEGFPHHGALFGLVSYNEHQAPQNIGSFITQFSDAPFSSQEKADDVKLEAKVSSRECQVATKQEAVSRDQVLKVQSCFCGFDRLCKC